MAIVKQLMKGLEEVRIEHFPRTKNRKADALANLGALSGPEGLERSIIYVTLEESALHGEIQ